MIAVSVLKNFRQCGAKFCCPGSYLCQDPDCAIDKLCDAGLYPSSTALLVECVDYISRHVRSVRTSMVTMRSAITLQNISGLYSCPLS